MAFRLSCLQLRPVDHKARFILSNCNYYLFCLFFFITLGQRKKKNFLGKFIKIVWSYENIVLFRMLLNFTYLILIVRVRIAHFDWEPGTLNRNPDLVIYLSINHLE